MTAYVIAILIFATIYALLGLGLNLQWGHMGLVNFGHVAFFALGAYTSALLTLAGVPMPVAGSMGAALAGVFAYVLGSLTVQLKEDYLAVVTLGFAEVLRILLQNQSWTGGPNGLPGVPVLLSFLERGVRDWAQLVLLAAVLAFAFYALARLTNSPYGRVMRAIREDDTAVDSIGKDVDRYKVSVFTLGSVLAGLAGALYAHYIGYVVPDQFVPQITFFLWTGIVLGGNSHLGAAMGTFAFIALFEATRFLGDFGLPVDETLLAHLRYIIAAVVLILLLRFRPDGVLPHRHIVRRVETSGRQ